MDNQLNLEEIYEHSWPIDTFEARSKFEWQIWPNAYSGNIFLFSAFEDEGNIVGAYWKSVSYDRPSRGLDTLFMFRMNFDGEILLKKEIRCYDSDSNHRNGLYKDKSRAAGQQYVFREKPLQRAARHSESITAIIIKQKSRQIIFCRDFLFE